MSGKKYAELVKKVDRSRLYPPFEALGLAKETNPARPGVGDPLSIPAAARSSTGVGGVFRTKVKDRSSKTVISAGTTVPSWAELAALYCFQNSMMLTPWGPSAVPTGGAGVAFPAGIWILTTAATRRLPIRNAS